MPPHRPPPSPKRIAGLWVLGAKWAGGTIDGTMHRKKKKDGWNYAQERTQVHSRYNRIRLSHHYPIVSFPAPLPFMKHFNTSDMTLLGKAFVL